MAYRLLVFLAVIAVVFIYMFATIKKSYVYKKTVLPTIAAQLSTIPSPSRSPKIRSVFVPYWADIDDVSSLKEFDRLFYFGISPSENGLDETEKGYLALPTFATATAPLRKKRYLVIRMIDDTATNLLTKKETWETIRTASVEQAQKYHFDGIALDIEFQTLEGDAYKKRVNNFVGAFFEASKRANIKLALILYGDTIFRGRPLDVATLVESSDEVMIMAYNFHKTLGAPGPNFPFGRGEKYGYDFEKMTEDFLYFIRPHKITVIFGMFGYDWIVDSDKRPIKRATSLTLHQIQEKFLTSCSWKNCVVKRDNLSRETEINYVDEVPRYHIVWFEDEKSAAEKTAFLEEKNITSTAFWAWGYY